MAIARKDGKYWAIRPGTAKMPAPIVTPSISASTSQKCSSLRSLGSATLFRPHENVARGGTQPVAGPQGLVVFGRAGIQVPGDLAVFERQLGEDPLVSAQP